jgi:ADP-ribosylglycohydrolase
MIDDALDAGHVVYLHCRAGIGRSATVAACWLANRGAAPDPLDQLQLLWQQSERSRRWPVVPETEEQAEFVREWSSRARLPTARREATAGAPRPDDRVRGALLGLALGDATGTSAGANGKGAGHWTQHTALALCLAESLLETGGCDARDQIKRYLAWQRDGHLSANGLPGQATADVARALAAYHWRAMPMAGSHDPKDRTTSSLPRIVSAAAFAADDPAAAVALAVECARTTHQSPIVLEACRYFAALMVGALRGEAAARLLADVYEPVADFWKMNPLKAEFVAAFNSSPQQHEQRADVVNAVANARTAVAAAGSVAEAIERAIRAGREPALDGALAGALAGALWGAGTLPAGALSGLARRDVLEQFAARFIDRQRSMQTAEQVRR